MVTFGPGLRVLADSRDLVERQVALSGTYEPAVERVMRAVLQPGDTAIDVGAHVGLHTLYAAALVGTEGQVVALEPNQDVARRLRFNVELNCFEDRVTIVEVAASDSAAEALLHLSDDPTNSGGASLNGQASPTTTTTVACDRLDALIPGRIAERCTFIKIDAEGHEQRVLEGAVDILSRRPTIVFECNSRATCDALTDRGYVLFAIEDDARRPIEPRRLSPAEVLEAVHPGQGMNLAAVAPDAASWHRLAGDQDLG